LLFGHTLKGQDYWEGTAWVQKRTLDGKLSHTGTSFHTANLHDVGEGQSWIEDDRLCERWSNWHDEIAICMLIFRGSKSDQNNYYMMTDTGPHPFQVSN